MEVENTSVIATSVNIGKSFWTKKQNKTKTQMLIYKSVYTYIQTDLHI